VRQNHGLVIMAETLHLLYLIGGMGAALVHRGKGRALSMGGLRIQPLK